MVRVILEDVGSDRVAANILVQMTQDTDELVLGADLGLSVSAKFLEDNKEVLESLESGDKIKFEASIEDIGD